MKRLAIITTHPIQYNAPFFRLLTQRGIISVKIFYTWSQSVNGNIFDPGFGINKAWDIPLLDGYAYTFSHNSSKRPGSDHFKGIINPLLINEIREYNPDAILVYGWSFYSHLKVMRYFKNKVALYFRGDSTLLDDLHLSFIKRRLRYFFLRWVYGHIDVAFYPGQASRKYFLLSGLQQHQLSFMPHAVDNERFASPPADNVKKTKDQFDIPADDIVLLFAGKLEEKKNPGLLIDVFSELGYSNVHLLVVGNGVLESTLKAKYSDVRNLHFMPFQNQSVMPAVYGACDIFILPSKGPGESWGLAVNEAMAAGKAVLTSDKCGCSADLVKPGKNGYVFRSGDGNDLRDKLKLLLQQGKTGLMSFGSASRQEIYEWNFTRCAEAIEAKLIHS
jgi:glycosyltransferase involved in cell wall biosynthesis